MRNDTFAWFGRRLQTLLDPNRRPCDKPSAMVGDTDHLRRGGGPSKVDVSRKRSKSERFQKLVGRSREVDLWDPLPSGLGYRGPSLIKKHPPAKTLQQDFN